MATAAAKKAALFAVHNRRGQGSVEPGAAALNPALSSNEEEPVPEVGGQVAKNKAFAKKLTRSGVAEAEDRKSKCAEEGNPTQQKRYNMRTSINRTRPTVAEQRNPVNTQKPGPAPPAATPRRSEALWPHAHGRPGRDTSQRCCPFAPAKAQVLEGWQQQVAAHGVAFENQRSILLAEGGRPVPSAPVISTRRPTPVTIKPYGADNAKPLREVEQKRTPSHVPRCPAEHYTRRRQNLQRRRAMSGTSLPVGVRGTARALHASPVHFHAACPAPPTKRRCRRKVMPLGSPALVSVCSAKYSSAIAEASVPPKRVLPPEEAE